VLSGGAVGGRPAAKEGGRVAALDRVAAGVVVLDLVVVPGGDEAVAGVGRLEVAVGLVRGVADPVGGQVGLLLGQVAVGGVPALLEVLADTTARPRRPSGTRGSAQVLVRPSRLR
jgi:hypothetical protein